ncbi:YceD family protein [Flavobacterium sp.]|uniref:YceD family protein n=1 Tax=Flavobacterium sp. TaxID=239 RepID=UPI00374CBDEF
MKVTNEFLIPFIGLKLGKHQFEYQISKAFFEHFEFDEFESANIKVNIVLEKKNTMLELNFKHSGTINVPCDLTSEDFDLPIKGNLKLVVRFGETFNDENEDLLILPIGEHQIDVAQYIYEMVVLSIPLKKTHPGIKDGTLETKALSKLKEISVTEQAQEENVQEETEIKAENTDPRWDKLKTLLTDK